MIKFKMDDDYMRIVDRDGRNYIQKEEEKFKKSD